MCENSVLHSLTDQKERMIKIALLTLGFAGLCGVAACSSDKALTITTSNESGPTSTPGLGTPPPGITIPGNTLPPGLTLPPGVTLPDISDLTIPEITLPPGLTLPPGVTLPDITDLSIPGLTIPDIGGPGLTIPNIPPPDGSSPPVSVDAANLKDCDIFRLILGEVFTGQESGLGDIQSALDQLAKTVPAEYADDLKTLSDSFITIHEVLVKNDYDYNALFTDPAALAAFSAPGFSEALGNLETYYATQCGAVLPES